MTAFTSSAAESLDEAGDELLTALRLGAGRVLRRALHTTNAIENVFSQVRYRTHRVKQWLGSTDQIQRWVAVCVLHTERRCLRIFGYFECSDFVAKLQKQTLPGEVKAA